MVKIFYGILIAGMLIGVGLLVFSVSSVQASPSGQQPTVSIATVTGTPVGAVVRVNADNEQINVRNGPDTDFDAIGVLIAGQEVAALGRSAGGSWILVAYPGVAEGKGWVYSPLVTLVRGGDLPIVEPPPTATPRVTATINPTMAAQFILDPQTTRLPTFTPPPPLALPTFEPIDNTPVDVGIPVGLVIVIMAAVGVMGLLFSLLRGR